LKQKVELSRQQAAKRAAIQNETGSPSPAGVRPIPKLQ
jgi:hypothetical protein